MSNDILHSKIELLEEQIENIERSGHFTENEIDRLAAPMRTELENLKKQINLYGMTPEQYSEGVKIHNIYFTNILKNTKSDTPIDESEKLNNYFLMRYGRACSSNINIFDMISISKG